MTRMRARSFTAERLDQTAESVFLKVYADGQALQRAESQLPGADKSYTFTVKLKPGLIRYRVEFGG